MYALISLLNSETFLSLVSNVNIDHTKDRGFRHGYILEGTLFNFAMHYYALQTEMQPRIQVN